MEERGTNNHTLKETVVLDTNSLLMESAMGYLRRYRCYTVPEVIDEVKTLRHKACIETLIDLRVLNIIDPSEKHVSEVIRAARSTGDIISLSYTDIKILALTLQLKEQGLNPVLLTDDYTVQNLASYLKITYKNLKIRPIKRRIKWQYRCPACNNIYHVSLIECPICGHSLKREVAKYESL